MASRIETPLFTLLRAFDIRQGEARRAVFQMTEGSDQLRDFAKDILAQIKG